MKNIPQLRFAGFDGEWTKGTLSDLGSVSMNRRIYKEETSKNGDVPFYKIGTFGSKADSYISRDLFEEYKSKYSYPKVGDLLISASGSIGKVIEYKGEDAYYQDSNIVWLDVNEKVKNIFLKQFYETVNWNELEGSTIKRLYNKDLLRKKISYPKLSEQEKIGDLFKKIDALIEKQEVKVSKMEDYKKSMLQKMFPKKDELVPEFRFYGFDGEWEKKKISDIGKITAGGDVDKKKINNKGRYPVIANGDSNNGIIGYYEDYYKISEPAVTISARGNIGTAVARNYPFTPVIRVLTLTSDNNIYFMSEAINRLRIFNESSGVPQLTSPQFGGYNIFMAKLSEQEKIGNFFKNLDTQIENEEKLLESYKMMKKSLLQKMFV